MASANYIEACSELKVKIEVGHPLTTVAEVRRRVTEPDKVEMPAEVISFIHTSHKFIIAKLRSVSSDLHQCLTMHYKSDIACVLHVIK